MPSRNSTCGSKTCQACLTNSWNLRLAFSVFTLCRWNLGSLEKSFHLIEFVVAESAVVNFGFIVGGLGEFDLFSLGGEPLQERLHGPRLVIACAIPKERGRFVRATLLDKGVIKTFLKLEPATGEAAS